jgi:phage-related protein
MGPVNPRTARVEAFMHREGVSGFLWKNPPRESRAVPLDRL